MGLLRRPVDYSPSDAPGAAEAEIKEPGRLRRPALAGHFLRPQSAPTAGLLRRPVFGPIESGAPPELSELLLLYNTRTVPAEDPAHTCVWCLKYDQWSFPLVCLASVLHFSKANKNCRICLGVEKRHHWPEPFASIERPDKTKYTKRRKRRRGKKGETEAELKNIGPQEQEEEWEEGSGPETEE